MENMVELESNDIVKDNIEKLKQIFPDIVKDGNIDFDTLKTILGEEIETDNESYKFEWTGKQNCYKTVQRPSNGTLKYIEEDSLNPDISENLIIEGDNLEVLKLLQSSYKNSIKMIYIDPPYNTGNDFVYPDNFETPLDNYLELTGQKENGETTQSKKSKEGRKHTQWLNMIFPRLLLSKTLLKKEGMIFISIDDNEYDNLKKVCDIVFGEENYVSTLIWKKKSGGGSDSKYFVGDHEYILVYSNDISEIKNLFMSMTDKQKKEYKFKDENFEDLGPYKRKNLYQTGIDTDRPNLRYEILSPNDDIILPPTIWRWSKERFLKEKSEGKIDFIQNKNGDWTVYTKMYLFDGQNDDNERKIKPRSILVDYGLTRDGNKDIKNIFKDGIFDYPKPVNLIKHFLEVGTNSKENDLILDFFGGSGTTGQSILELNKDGGNRKFILVQLPEPTSNPDYPYISDITKERIRRVINGYGDNPQPINNGFKVFKLDNSNYKINEKININKDTNKVDIIKKLRSQFKTSTVHDESLVDGYNETDIIYENIIKEGYNLNSKIMLVKDITQCKIYKVSNSVNSKKFYITFDKVDTSITEQKEFMGISNDTLFICFEHNLSDSDKTNLTKTFLLKTI